jgi:hypothetical protein
MIPLLNPCGRRRSSGRVEALATAIVLGRGAQHPVEVLREAMSLCMVACKCPARSVRSVSVGDLPLPNGLTVLQEGNAWTCMRERHAKMVEVGLSMLMLTSTWRHEIWVSVP